jgi:quercetin dioxygenase-like cupin family protein/DNA-binding XRE family transcriptional regulator
VSPSLISQIEMDKSQPSVSTLFAITTALDITIESLFDDQPEQADAQPERAARQRHGGRNPVVHPTERESLTLDSGVVWERLGQVPNTHVDFLLITYLPGSTSSSSGQLMRHSGTEYGHLLKGSLVLTLGFDEYRLSAGDSVSFDSTTPHRYRNDGRKPAVGVWFVLERG